MSILSFQIFAAYMQRLIFTSKIESKRSEEDIVYIKIFDSCNFTVRV